MIEEEKVRDEIFQSLFQNFGIHISSFQPIDRGWRNHKWIIDTNQGTLFVKQYHPKRYPLKKMESVKQALRFQSVLAEQGFPCPNPIMYEESPIIFASDETYYTLTDCLPGELIQPGTANAKQMYNLGQITGWMHETFKRFPTLKVDWRPNKAKMIEAWKKNLLQAQQEQRSSYVLSSIESQGEIVERLDIDQFDSCKTGWAHWDLYVDNLLFMDDRVSGVLDFDRVTVIYPELDVARAIMSCVLKEQQLELNKVTAFLAGYNEYLSYSGYDLARSLKMLWCKEFTKWIRPEMEERLGTALRFANEILWISKHWYDLDEMLAEVQISKMSG